ncbi:hypothetical protein [Kitasatospora sp. NPDC085879]|uniref:hypothetical protein n=1 Tax=Kitasatospora sp. NPDC085879 TaxID=3154769 RepID=UPI00343612D1
MTETPQIHVSTKLVEGLGEATPEQIAQLAARTAGRIWFTTPLTGEGEAPKPDQIWTLRGSYPHNGKTATGTAHVYLGKGNRRLQRPLILADGFNYGPSDLPGLWKHFDKAEGGRFLTALREAGTDVILLGFDERHTYIQANAGVAAACIERATAERVAIDPLTVGGVSMGGMITRYALARMEDEGIDHHTAVYFSWDTPHQGAWIPLILQQMAHFFEDFVPEQPGVPKQAELLRSPAAQQLLWAWVENSKYEGPVGTASPLRTEFLADLRARGNYPKRPLKLGVANGNGGGVGLELTPGEIAFDWKKDQLRTATATARIQPDRGEKQPIGGMNIAFTVRRSSTTAVPALDGAPGGTLASFGLVAEALGADVDDRFDFTCFVPSISAVGLAFDPERWERDPFTDLSAIGPEEIELDDFCCDEGNSPHSEPRPVLTKWLVDRLTR